MEFSDEEAVLKDIYKSDKVNVFFLCAVEGQEALQDTSDHKVTVLVNSGSGTITSGEETFDINEGDLAVIDENESRILKAKSGLTAVVTVVP